MSCGDRERWPQDRTNVVCVTPSGQVKWMRYWDPVSEFPMASPPLWLEIARVVTETTFAFVYREVSTDKWFMSSIRTRDGATRLHHFDLGITDDRTIADIAFTPLRSEIHFGLNPGGSSSDATVYGIDENGTVTTGTSDPESGGGSVTSEPRMMPNGELVTFVTDGNDATVVVTDEFGEVWRETDFATTPGPPSFRGVAVEDSTTTGVMLFMLQSANNDNWDWWELDSAAQSLSRRIVADADFTPPVDGGEGQIGKGGPRNGQVWTYASSLQSSRLQLRDALDDTDDVLVDVDVSDFDTGGQSFNTTLLFTPRWRKPGYMIDDTGRFYYGARNNASTRLLAVDESDVRRFSNVKDATTVFAEPIVIADGEALVNATWNQVTGEETETGNTPTIGDFLEASEAISVTMDPIWLWKGQAIGGTGSQLRPLSWRTDSGAIIFFAPALRTNLGSGLFSRYYEIGNRMLDITREPV